MKKTIYLILILFLISFVSAEKYTQGQIIDVSGHKVTVQSVGENSAIFNVDGVKNIVTLNNEVEINGVSILVIEVMNLDDPSSNYVDATFTALTTASGATIGSCGDGTCNSGEDKINCCLDCSCESGYSCINTKCEKDSCNDNEDCWSNVTNRDFCKSYRCEGTPKKCVTSPITECVVNDKCCPSNCYYPGDPDCDKSKVNPNPQPSIKQNITNQSEIIITSEKKIGLFQRFINWIISIFK